MRPRPSIRTQILIFTLFGEYIVPRKGKTWTKSLLELLTVLGVSERAARSTLSRMCGKGWLVSERVGRYSRYSLTRIGQRVVRSGEIRIFETRRKDWDDRWHMVVYSIPEGKRSIRSSLRTSLKWLGFGRLAPGTWISPNDRRSEVEEVLEGLAARAYTVYFGGMELFFASTEEIVERCWDLKALNSEYERFLNIHMPSYEAFTKGLKRGNPFSPTECFRQRFWLTLEYGQFPRRDPNLPKVLLPTNWLGTRASKMFHEYHQLLREPSETFVTDVLNSDPG